MRWAPDLRLREAGPVSEPPAGASQRGANGRTRPHGRAHEPLTLTGVSRFSQNPLPRVSGICSFVPIRPASLPQARRGSPWGSPQFRGRRGLSPPIHGALRPGVAGADRGRWRAVALAGRRIAGPHAVPSQFGHVPLRQGEGAEWTQACGALSPPPALPVTRAELRGPGGHQVKPERPWPPYR